MSKLTKTLTAGAIAIATAVATSPVLANHEFFSGSNTSIKISASGCPSVSGKNLDTDLSIDSDEDGPNSGNWTIDVFSFGDFTTGLGNYVDRRLGKELTMGPDDDSYAAVFAAVQQHVIDENCGTFLESLDLKRFDARYSKNMTRIKVRWDMNGKYNNNDNKMKNVNFKLNTGRMDVNNFTK